MLMLCVQDSFDLFYGLFKYNHSSIEQLRRLEAGFEEVKRLLLKADTDATDATDATDGVGSISGAIATGAPDEYTYTFSPIVEGVPPSKTIVVFGKVKELQVLQQNTIFLYVCSYDRNTSKHTV
jgi:hypothetical protein